MSEMLKEERLQLILEALHKNKKMTVNDLSRLFGVSDITIRRDLRELAEKGLLRRAHGGALATSAKNLSEPPVIQRMSDTRNYKEAIGRATAQLVQDNESIFLGSGSTTAYIARYLTQHRGLTVVTNAVNIAMEFTNSEGVTVVVLGGMFRASELSLIGHLTEQALQEIRVDKVIIGIRAISLDAGLTNDYLPEVMTDRAILKMAEELIVVADHTKFGKVTSGYIGPIDRVRTLVTDKATDPELLNDLRTRGISVIVAD